MPLAFNTGVDPPLSSMAKEKPPIHINKLYFLTFKNRLNDKNNTNIACNCVHLSMQNTSILTRSIILTDPNCLRVRPSPLPKRPASQYIYYVIYLYIQVPVLHTWIWKAVHTKTTNRSSSQLHCARSILAFTQSSID